MIHLDFECARCSERIAAKFPNDGEKGAKEVETAITRALGILQEEGPYAFYLFMKARSSPLYPTVERETVDFLKASHLIDPAEADGLNAAKALCCHLDRLLMSKELLERILVYARYHAKARGGGS